MDGSPVCGCAGAAAGAFGAATLGVATGGAGAALTTGGCSAGVVELCAIATGTSADIVSSTAINAAMVASRLHFIFFLIINDMPIFRCSFPPADQIFFEMPTK
jgi:hypothetical protein